MTNYERDEDGKLWAPNYFLQKRAVEEMVEHLRDQAVEVENAHVSPTQFVGSFTLSFKYECEFPKLDRPQNAASTWGRGRSFAARQRRQRRIAWGFPE